MFTDDHSRLPWGVPIKTNDPKAEGLHALVRRLLTLHVYALGKYTAMEGRRARGGSRSCVYRLGSSRPTPCKPLMETPSLSVVLAPLRALRAVSS